MAKITYKIPVDLNQSFGDMEIALQSNSGVGVKPLPVRVILSYIVSAILCIFLCMRSFLSSNIGYWLPFAICWVCLTLVLVRYDKTKRMNLQMVPSLLAYIPKKARHVIVRKDKRANEFMGICGIDSIDTDTGLIKFIDGTSGIMYRVVGSASILLFEEDRDSIINRVDSFFRKLGTDCELSFITTKESQKVYRQIANLKRRYDNLDTDDEDLKMLAEEQFHVLKYDIGNSFRSIHQYMILKADNGEVLLKNKNIIQSEFENSTLMFKQCLPLDYNDVIGVLHSIYA